MMDVSAMMIAKKWILSVSSSNNQAIIDTMVAVMRINKIRVIIAMTNPNPMENE